MVVGVGGGEREIETLPADWLVDVPTPDELDLGVTSASLREGRVTPACHAHRAQFLNTLRDRQ